MMRRISFGMAAAVHAAGLKLDPQKKAPRIRKKKIMKRKEWWKECKPNSGRDGKKYFLKGLR